jgi:predicted metal-dependent peptidase
MNTPPPDPRIERARMGLVLDTPFFGSLIVRLKVEPGYQRPTFCTDGLRIRYNRDYADTLSDGELKYILCHEIMHCALGHLWRISGRDLQIWNQACDYVVNQMLDEFARDAATAGQSLPWTRPAGLLNIADKPQWRGLSAEEIYRDIMQERQHQGQKPPSQVEINGGEGHPGPGDFEMPPADGGPRPGQEPGAETGVEEDWQIATVQAERIANMKGNCPGTASHLVNEIKKPKVSWRDVLREFIRVRAKADYSFSRPNRRQLGRGFIFPSLHSERMGRIVAAFDSSGSTRRYVCDFQAEVQAALDECLPERIDVIVCDAKVQHFQSFEPGETVTIDAKGGGGTDFRPVFDLIANPNSARTTFDFQRDREEPPVCVVYLTDLEGTFPVQKPDYPVLWCAVGHGSRKPPFGEIIAVK